MKTLQGKRFEVYGEKNGKEVVEYAYLEKYVVEVATDLLDEIDKSDGALTIYADYPKYANVVIPLKEYIKSKVKEAFGLGEQK